MLKVILMIIYDWFTMYKLNYTVGAWKLNVVYMIGLILI